MKIKLCIMSAFLSVFLLFSSFSVKANEIVFPAFPEPVEGKSSTHYLIFYSKESGYYNLIKPLNPNSVFAIKDSSQDRLTLRFNEPAIVYRLENNNWVYQTIIDDPPNYHFLFYFDEDLRQHDILYSSFDIYYLYNNEEIFFQRAPIKANFLTQMKKIQMGAVMTTVVYLIPLLIPLLVFLMGFRKAWAWLSRVLRKA